MRILAKIKADSSNECKSEILYMTPEEFEKPFYIQNGNQTYCTQSSAIWWSKNGRLGSHWQIDEDMYVLVEQKGEDPYKYYKPNLQKSKLYVRGWCTSSSKCGNSGCSC